MTVFQFMTKLFNHGFVVSGWYEEDKSIELSKEEKLIIIDERECYTCFSYWNKNKKRWLANNIELK